MPESKAKFVLSPILIVVLLCVGLVLAVILLNIFAPEDTSWRKDTTPLSYDSIRNLCQKLSLPHEHELCDPDKIVYADEFYPIITRKFPVGKGTFEEVDKALGEYAWRREQTYTNDKGRRYYVIWYDFKGDRVTSIVYFFWEDDQKCLKIIEKKGMNDS